MEDVPKSSPVPRCHVGITYNLKKGVDSNVADIEAEYDNIETVWAIKKALEQYGCSVDLLEADEYLPERLKKAKVDIIFNIAEGTYGRGREAQVPALLNFYRIPFTGSDETTLCIALDKALTKRLLSSYKVRTPKYKIISKENQDWNTSFPFPAIVKPNAEGSSKGISDVAIVNTKEELKTLVQKNLAAYGQDMPVEEDIAGREFTVGVFGNGEEIHVFPPMEIVFINNQDLYNIYSYPVKQEYKKHVRYDCPALIDRGTEEEMVETAKKIYRVLACKDLARMDFRLSNEGKLYFIEINPLPGLAPGYSDFPMLAQFSGMDYDSLVQNVLCSALKRHGLASCL